MAGATVFGTAGPSATTSGPGHAGSIGYTTGDVVVTVLMVTSGAAALLGIDNFLI